MTFTKTWPAGAPANSTVTAAEINDLDTKTAGAWDKSGDSASGTHHLTAGTIFIDAAGTLRIQGDVKIENTGEVTGVLAVLAPGEIDIGDSTNLNAGVLRVTDHSQLQIDALSSTTASGPIVLTSATGKLTTSGGGSIELGNNDYTKWGGAHPAKNPVRRINFADFPLQSPFAIAASGLGLSAAGTASVARFAIPIGPGFWNNIAILSVKLYFTPVAGHGGLPGNNINATLKYFTPTNGVAAVLGTLGSTATYAPVSLVDYNNGNVKVLTLNPGTPTIDTTVNCYLLEVQDENGTNALPGNVFHCLEISYTASDFRPQ
jgi:hypothetical protein